LGIVKIDKELQEILINALGPQALILDQAHEPEHSIEVQVPFMQVLTQAESFVPVLAGVNADYQLMGQILAEIVQQFDDVGFVFSSDLSHYLPYDVAKQVDSQTIEAILQGDVEFITGERACGYMGIRAYIIMTELLKVKREFVLYLNSGDTAGDKSHVV
jgi:AmmeMemoRadiSam system protein B